MILLGLSFPEVIAALSLSLLSSALDLRKMEELNQDTSLNRDKI